VGFVYITLSIAQTIFVERPQVFDTI